MPQTSACHVGAAGLDPRLLFLWQLLWLQVQAAPILELAMDSILLTSIPLGPTEPWSWDQQNPSNIESHFNISMFNPDASALLSEAPDKMEPSPNPQEPQLSFHSNKKSQL